MPYFDITAALLYSVLLLLCAGARQHRLRFGVPVLAVWLLVPVTDTAVFAAQASLYICLTWLLRSAHNRQRWLKSVLWLFWVLLTTGLLIHALPGYQGLALASVVPVKANSLATSIYLNTDKVLIAWAIMQWLPVWQHAPAHPAPPLPRNTLIALPLSILGIVVILGLAVLLNLIQWQPAFSPLLAIIVMSNLINTCFTEELMFRGALQTWLQPKAGWLTAITFTSLLFGLAHFAGGPFYMLLATLAGILYGLVYQITGRLLWAVLCHWGLNATHMLLLTWPMLEPG